MKTNINGLSKNGRLLIASLFLTFISVSSFSQEITKICSLTPIELKAKFSVLIENADLKLLSNDLTGKGWSKLSDERMAYGVTGTRKDETGKSFPFELYVFDYYNKATSQTGALLWKNDGKSVYKAYIMFPSGEKDIEKALEQGVEMYVEGGKIQKASSFGTCFNKCISKKCPGYCITAAFGCGIASIAIVVATQGGGGAIAFAFWLGCAGLICANCFINVCAYNCG